MVEEPLIRVAADIMGTLPASSNRYEYMLVVQDLFTRYAECRPLRTKTEANIIKALEELAIFRWACPRYILSDNGEEFANRVVINRLQEYGITVERVNRVL